MSTPDNAVDNGDSEPLAERRLREALDLVTAALREQRYDLHADDGRPCEVCSRSSRALNVADTLRIAHDHKRWARANPSLSAKPTEEADRG